jgi:p-hydroxybenzoate 3-monooxygenase
VRRIRTQVGIVGAGPAGLLLSHLLHLDGIDSVIVENRSRDYVEHRVRAGVLEQGSVDLLNEAGVGERMRREGLVHHGIELRFGGTGHRIDFPALTGGRSITVYGQQEVVKDLIAARLAAGGQILFESTGVAVHDLESEAPRITFAAALKKSTFLRYRCRMRRLPRDLPAGDSRPYSVRVRAHLSVRMAWHPGQGATDARRADLRLSRERLRALQHALTGDHAALSAGRPGRGPRALAGRTHLARTPSALETSDGWALREGSVLEKGITGMRSFVAEPMQYGRLYLAGDAAHIVPPTGPRV